VTPEPGEKEAAAPQLARHEGPGQGIAGPQQAGQEAPGRGTVGPEEAGQEVAGRRTVGPEEATQEASGQGTAGPEQARQEAPGRGTVGPEGAGQEAEQEVAGLEEARQEAAGQWAACREAEPWLAPLYPLLYEEVVRRALTEDLGRAGDLTSDAVLGPEVRTEAAVVARAPGRLAGLAVALSAFRLLDPGIEVTLHRSDGQDVAAGEVLATVRGAARPILSAERTALNLLGRLCGVATATRALVAVAAPHGAQVVCTRKTTPGLRALEKYAVRAGGGANHRFGLDDAVLIKDNHRALAGGLRIAVERARRGVGHMVKIEVEVDTLAQLDEALALDVDAVLLDNMDLPTLAEAVRRVRHARDAASVSGNRQARGSSRRVLTEASGGITPATAAAVAATGVDMLSAGWLTHSAPALDVALDIVADVDATAAGSGASAAGRALA
jgi:nicotinate-nucleotide pyrophosphorylase (carboxylating)